MRLLGKVQNDELIDVYSNIKTAAEHNGVSAPAISMAMKHVGRCRTYHWKWIDIDSDNIIEDVRRSYTLLN